MCLLVATEFPDAQRQALELYSDRSGEPELRIMQPTLASSSADVGRPLEVPSYSHSGRLNGLVLLISRLVRSLWTKPILNVAVDKGQSIASAGAQLEDYVRVKLRLAALRSTIFRLAEIRDPARFAVGVRISDAVKGEQQLFQDITRLLSETIEAIEFIEILHELNIIDSYRM